MEKLKAVFDKLSGTKTITGLLMIVAYYAVPHFTSIKVPDVVLNLGIGWAGVGFAHKLDKVTGILSQVLDVLTKTQETVNKDEGEKK